MARIQASVKLDPFRAPEQLAFLRERVEVLREVGGQLWVGLEDTQVDTLIAQGMEVLPQPEAGLVELPALAFRPEAEPPEPPEALRAEEPSGEATGDYLVKFRAPIDKAWLQEIATLGGELLQALPSSAAVFRFTRQEAASVRALAYVAYVGPFHPVYAVSIDLTGAQAAFTASSLRSLQVTLPADDPEGNLRLRFFDGINPASRRAAVEAAGATIVSDIAHGFQVRAPQGRANDILRVAGLFAAELPTRAALLNNNGGVILGANQVRTVGTTNFLVNLTGVGEIAGMVDSGCDVGNLAGAVPPFVGAAMTAFHADLRTNVRLVRNSGNPQNVAGVAPDGPAQGGPHGTHVAGTICGDGTSSAGQLRGVAPAASLIAQGPLPGNFEPPFEFAFENGARIINNSWGSSFSVGINNNRYIASHGFALDRWCFDHPDVLLLFAAGNDETDVAAGGDGNLDADRLKLEATAKNVFTVGASENLRNNGGWRDNYRAFFGARYNHAAFNATAGAGAVAFSFSDNHNQVALFSSRGTIRTNASVNTQRVKPDITAPGTNVLSVRSQWVAPPPALPAPPIPAAFWNANSGSMVPAGINRNLYEIMTGTSMATPMTTGCAILVRQYYRTRFAQLRRPMLLEGVTIPAAPAPQPAFTAFPSNAPHVDGIVCAWVTPAVPAGPKRIMAMRFSRPLVPMEVTPVQLQNNVGNQAAPKVVTRGERTYLLHRHADNSMRLSCYNRTLQPEATFGTNGVVTLAPGSRLDANVLPDLLVVGDHVACAFPATGGNGYFFQRFRADTGAPVDGASLNVLTNTNTGPHGSVAHSGARYTVCGVVHPGNYQLQTRQIGNDGALVGAGPTTLVDQAQELREPCLIWNARLNRYVVVWVDARTVPGGEIYLLFLDANGAAIRAPRLVMSVPPANHLRRPRLLVHPEVGHVLLWEDDTQNAHYDLYVALLDDLGQVDGRLQADANDPLNRRIVRISDTPENTAGFAAIADARGTSLVFQSPDEINSDRLGAYALNMTPDGAFEAQADPSTPLLWSGRYKKVDLLSHGTVGLTALSAEWTGGSYYHLRVHPGAGGVAQLQWARLNADGLLDSAYGAAGVRTAPVSLMLRSCQILWTGNGLVTVGNDLLGGIGVYRHDDQGAPIAAFGIAGTAVLQDTVTFHDDVTPQVGWDPTNSRALVAYGTTQAGALQLRHQVLNGGTGAQVGAPVNLTQATGVASHNWFQFVPSEGRSIAIYHRVNGAVTRVHVRRFLPTGAPSGGELNVSAAAGEGINAVLARRPTFVNSTNREYGAAWQYRANNASRWEIHFCRLDRLGQPMANPPAPAAPTLPPPPMAVSDVTVISSGPDWPANQDAVEPQLVCTYTHWPWANPPTPLPAGTSLPQWSPSYGLAWIGVMPDGSRVLFFTVLDENGRRAMIPRPPPVGAGALQAPVAAPLLQITAINSRVRNFKLVWNGRIFLLFWVEEEGGQLKHRVTAVNRHVNQLAYDLPSAALLRATLVNGATNPSSTSLPDTANGYGWGRVNLRQTLAPAPPVTLQVRDDCAIGPGRTVTYRFNLPSGTALLRVTLNWTDPPGDRVVNPLHLTVRAPAVGPNPRPEYRGNLWDATAGRTHLSRPTANPPVAADNHENIQTFKQVVIANPPPGAYDVEVSVGPFPADPFNQQNLQAFALVFAGTGPEVAFNQPVASVQGTPVY
jgi:serine protease AprX